LFQLEQNTIMPAVGASAFFIQGNAFNQAPSASALENVFIDP
jgi:hypothetical protein